MQAQSVHGTLGAVVLGGGFRTTGAARCNQEALHSRSHDVAWSDSERAITFTHRSRTSRKLEKYMWRAHSESSLGRV